MKYSPLKKPFRLSLGERGEMIAHGYLVRAGYKILEKNYGCKLGEIDVIAEKNGRIIFFEVKTRGQERFGPPEESVHPEKQRRLVRLAQWYLKEKKAPEHRAGFGVIAIRMREAGGPEIRLIEDAFAAD